MNNESINNELTTEKIAKLDSNLLKVTTNMARSLAFNEDDAYTEIAKNSDYILVQIGYNDSFNTGIDDNVLFILVFIVFYG